MKLMKSYDIMELLSKSLVLVVFVLQGVSCFAQLDKGVQELITDNCFRKGEISMYAVDIGKDQEIIDYRGDKLMTPASVQKLLTTSTALELLGPEYSFQTRFLIDKSDELAYGTLFGSLHIEVSGDPSLLNGDRQDNTLDYLAAQVAAKLVEKDINCFYDGILIHAGDFNQQAVPDGWVWQDLGNYYGSGCYPLNFNENTYSLRFDRRKGVQRPDILDTDPAMPFDFINDVTCSGSRDEAYIYPTRDPELMLVKGRIPSGIGPFTIKGSIPDPISHFVGVFVEALAERGISFGSDHVILIGQEMLIDREVLYTHRSAALTDLILETNFESNNLYAEALLMAMGGEMENGFMYEKGIKAIREYWKKNGIDLENARIMDGSGLSPQGKISARSVVKVLVDMASDIEHRDVFLSSIPEAGKSGTARNLDLRSSGTWRIKTGSMEGVRTYAGYLLDNERELAFCLMSNDITCEGSDAGRKLIQLLNDL
jgi:D-alanyl-D-alanine carboxypeptidase/D-alanyl-D-alanine-endopeptidase (penicillin-binding protein 4)